MAEQLQGKSSRDPVPQGDLEEMGQPREAKGRASLWGGWNPALA